jgi:hypothetical protein
LAHEKISGSKNNSKIAGIKMKVIGPKITINIDSDFWKSMQEAANLDAEKAATKAAEQARKETLARAAKRDAEHKAYLDSIYEYDAFIFPSDKEQGAIRESIARRLDFQKLVSKEYAIQDSLEKKIKESCCHDMVIERKTSYRDEFDYWHEGPYERKCVECFLVEEQGYSKLKKSRVILLRRIVDGKEYELEFDDLKWELPK